MSEPSDGHPPIGIDHVTIVPAGTDDARLAEDPDIGDHQE